ncbi:hypothetical protein [Lysinibacillus sp. NPDC086135]|uniref:hypothetical protein n=1 Tax=Lysinibacillus sp. NPDC086135 TaxID=3364130 RepID=UPI0037F9FBEF
MTNILLARYPAAKRLIGRPQEALLCAKAKRQQQMFFCAKAKRQQQMFFCAKAKRQQQSAQPERKSTTRYGDNPINENKDQLSSGESATGYFYIDIVL